MQQNELKIISQISESIFIVEHNGSSLSIDVSNHKNSKNISGVVLKRPELEEITGAVKEKIKAMIVERESIIEQEKKDMNNFLNEKIDDICSVLEQHSVSDNLSIIANEYVVQLSLYLYDRERPERLQQLQNMISKAISERFDIGD